LTQHVAVRRGHDRGMNKLMTAKEQAILLAVSGAVLLGAATIYFTRETGAGSKPAVERERMEPASNAVQNLASPPLQPVAIDGPPILVEPPPEQTPRTVTVSVVGSVEHSGVYTLPDGSRVNEILEKAGGVTQEADLSDINLAAYLIDGTTLTVPGTSRRIARSAAERNIAAYTISGQPSAAPVAPSGPDMAAAFVANSAAGTNGRIDLNSATQEQLEQLPGIGEKLGAAIVNYREKARFTSVEDLNNVPGIGAKKIEGLRDFVVVNPR
jgi:competence protein ComEA